MGCGHIEGPLLGLLYCPTLGVTRLLIFFNQTSGYGIVSNSGFNLFSPQTNIFWSLHFLLFFNVCLCLLLIYALVYLSFFKLICRSFLCILDKSFVGFICGRHAPSVLTCIFTLTFFTKSFKKLTSISFFLT